MSEALDLAAVIVYVTSSLYLWHCMHTDHHNSSSVSIEGEYRNPSLLQFGTGKVKQSSKHWHYTGTHQLDNGSGTPALVDDDSNYHPYVKWESKLQPCLNVGIHAMHVFTSKIQVQNEHNKNFR